ncbi:zinc metalloproteinase/disintegrin [Elysia marginata]|uniref:Zinc metalloproteinase/disintegrin n=1 Tax=Elysia marginata TaxID=1093978 RepID=A0AAV4GQJ4_9GAST|nr:zinc metalloproteinase/disintegrin [Elysia marginata]
MVSTRASELLLLLSLACSQAVGHVLRDTEMRQVSGRMLVLKPLSGTHDRLTRRHVDLDAESPQAVRLELGSEGISLDMTLTRRSVWTNESRAFEYQDGELVEVPLNLDPNCFMAGGLDSGEGSASFSFCDGVSGIVQTPEVEYLVEQTRELDSDEDISEVTVSVVDTSVEERDLEDDEELVAIEEEERIYFNIDRDSYNSSEILWKRDMQDEPAIQRTTRQNKVDITGEIAVYADKNYADFLKSTGRNTLAKATTFFANKWNTIARVYGDKSKVGVKFVLQLKQVEVWWTNPRYYRSVQNNNNLQKHLNPFCSNTRNSKADHRMLYTAGVGGGVMGLAWIGGICNPNRACSIVKNKSLSNLKVELHEFGHNLGFRHEPQMQPCSKPDGFMGWTRTHKFNDCYKRSFVQTYRLRSRDCLRQTNMKTRVLNG